MNRINWKKKLASRKLWVSVCSFVTLTILAAGGTESQATQITAVIMAGATVLGYVIGEGLVDAVQKGDDGNEN